MKSNDETPPFNEPLSVFGEDYLGEWEMTGYAVPFKPGSTKKQLKRVWRWLDVDGYPIRYVEGWDKN